MEPDVERRLIARWRHGDRQAFRRLFDGHRSYVYRIALRMAGSPQSAEDVEQESWMKAMDAIHSFDGRSRFKTWLTRIVINTAIDRRRKSERHPAPEHLREGTAAATHGPAAHAEAEELESALETEMQALPAEQRAALLLVGFEGLSYAQAAEAMSCPEGTLAWRIAEARRKLARRLAPYLD